MVKQYPDRHSNNRRASRRHHRRKRCMVTAVLLVTLIAVIAAIILCICHMKHSRSELTGTWTYDEHTQYAFGTDGSGELRADDVVYTYTYTVSGDRLIIDFTEDIVRDCEYTFSIGNDGRLTLVGGTGTDGGSYVLSKD